MSHLTLSLYLMEHKVVRAALFFLPIFFFIPGDDGLFDIINFHVTTPILSCEFDYTAKRHCIFLVDLEMPFILCSTLRPRLFVCLFFLHGYKIGMTQWCYIRVLCNVDLAIVESRNCILLHIAIHRLSVNKLCKLGWLKCTQYRLVL